MTIESTISEAVATATAAAARMLGRDDLSGDYDQVKADAKRAAKRTATEAPSAHVGTARVLIETSSLVEATYVADVAHAKSLVRATFAVIATSKGFAVVPQWSVSPDDRLYSTGN